MLDFLGYFFGAGTEPEFAIFTFAHFAPILILIAVLCLMYRYREPLRNYRYEQNLR